MAEEEPAEELRRPTMAIVSAGESEQSDDEAWVHEHEEPASEVKPDDLLYGENLDAEDEAWVYKHMRGGVEETVTLRQTKLKHSAQLHQATLQLLKPRTSDAVLSCPCCFAIVCMDCQQHERYQNQFRAMFVMNIGVEWNHELIYSQKTKTLIDKPPTPAHHVPLEHHQDQVYYSVHCSTCRTQVAALDMEDEVYHFFACLASA
jgi:hypothetical protein